MADATHSDDDVREFTKDNPPHPNEGVWYRSRETVHAAGPFTNVKVGGKHHKDQAGYVVVEDALKHEQSKVKWVAADEFDEKYAPARLDDPIPRPQGPHFDAKEASEEQATGYQMDPQAEGDDVAAAVLQDPQKP